MTYAEERGSLGQCHCHLLETPNAGHWLVKGVETEDVLVGFVIADLRRSKREEMEMKMELEKL